MKMIFRHIAFALLLLLSGNPLHSQLSAPQPRFRNYTVYDGLPGSETYFVHQDRKGYIWICTDRGVSRFDGFNFQNFTMADGLTDNVIFKIIEDHKGRIWFVTYNSKLCYFENEKIKPYKYNDKIANALVKAKSAPQKSFYIDKDDNVYMSMAFNGMLIIDAKGNTRKYKSGKDVMIKRVNNKLMWIFDYKEYGAGYVDLYYHRDGQKTKINTIGVYDRILLAAGKENDYMMDKETLRNLTTGKAIARVEDAISLDLVNHSFWIGTYKNGITHIPDISHPKQSFLYLGGLSVSSMLRDKEGGYWFTTLERGVFYSPSLSIKNYTKEEGLIDDEIVSIAGIKDNIYLGFMIGRWQNLKYPIQNNQKQRNSAIIGSSNHKFYISLDCTYEFIHGKQGKFLYNSWSRDYYNKGNSAIFGIQSIYQRYDDGRFSKLYNHLEDQSPLSKNIFQAVMQDLDGELWGGSLSGLIYIQNGSMTNKGLDDPLFKARVSDLFCHPRWKNIVATRGEGVYFFDHKKVIRQIKASDGLLSDLVNVLFLDEKGGIWVGTNKGLNYITQAANGKINIESFTVLHGLCSNEISCLYVYDGMVYAGTKGGLAVIDTKSFHRNKKFSKTIATSFEVGDKKLDPKIEHFLSHKSSYIKIAFRNENYRTLVSGSYQYRFNKWSKWITTSIPEISLINPLPGEYDLEIRYLNEDGIWSPPFGVCNFTIEEAFYNRWYFFVLVSVVLIVVGWRLFRYRIKQLKQRHMLNNKINQLEQKALQAQMNPHFIFNALNSIQSFLVYEENEKAEKYLLKFAQLIRQTLSNSREPYITVESEIDILEKYLDLERMRFKNKFKYRIINELNVSDLSLKIPSMLIQPFVENSVIHGFSTLESGGEIIITLKFSDGNQILCIIEDNGVGRKKAMQQSLKSHVSFGTTITEERLKAFEKKHGIHFKIETVDIEHEDGTTGTRVYINLPVI